MPAVGVAGVDEAGAVGAASRGSGEDQPPAKLSSFQSSTMLEISHHHYLPNLCAVLEYRRSIRLRPLRVNPHRPLSTW